VGIAPSHRLTRVLIGGSASLALVVGAFAAYGLTSYLGARDAGTQIWTTESGEGSQTDTAIGPCVERVCNYLLLGSDSRAGLTPEEQAQFGSNEFIGGTNRADTIMLVQLDPDREKAVVLSFPRDLWVRIPGVGWNRINTSFEGGVNGGGPRRVAETVHGLTGLTINHFLYVDLLGFQRVVDTLGGVEMCIPFDVQDPLSALDLQAGCQRLDGRQALAYVRTRHFPCDESAPDLHRIGRQQQFLRAVINQLLRPAKLVRAPSLVEPVLGNLDRDRGLRIADLVYLVGRLRGVSTGAVEFRTVPTVPDTVRPPGFDSEISILRMDPSARALFQALRRGTPVPRVGTELVNTPPSPANITVAVVDVGETGPATEAEDVVATSGFDVSPGIVSSQGAGVPAGFSGIVYAPGHLEEAQVVSQFFPGAQLREAGERLSWDIGIVAGTDLPLGSLGEAPAEPVC
jgi:LCP family protein required for cell wall assembly